MADTRWRTRGYLPHRDEPALIQHVVFNLADAFTSPRADIGSRDEWLSWAEAELDAGHGAKLLSKTENAFTVEECILREHGSKYALAAWCVMPNHVHVLVEQFPNLELSSIVQTWKSVTAHAINKREGRRGQLWQREYFDRFMRNEDQFASTVAYIENNPVAAGLAAHPEEWRFSSAWAGRWANDAGEGAGAPDVSS
jgi:putative transposase